MIRPEILNEHTDLQFIRNIKQKVHMVCWCYYSYEDGSEKMLDICQTKYYNNGFSLSARGITYMSIDSRIDDFTIEDCTLSGLKKIIHSFLEVDISNTGEV